MHERDRMATEKLDEGIKGFSKALENLEGFLATRLTQLTEGQIRVTHARDDLFKAYDLDGDGFITREEWLGTDAVFDALDSDHDGKLSPAEIGVGLGAAFQLA
jgi:transaldolase